MNDFLKLARQQLEKNGFVFCDKGIWTYKDDLYCVRCSREYLPEECIIFSECNSDGEIAPLGLHFVIPCKPNFYYVVDAAIACFVAEFKKQGCDFLQ